MKSTPAGVLTTIAFVLLPFVTTNQVFYGPVNAKFFFIVLLVDMLALMAAHRLYRRSEGVALAGRWMLGALALVVLVQFGTTFTGVFPERSLWSDIFWASGVLFIAHVAFLAWLLSELLTEYDWSLVRRGVAISSGVFALLLIVGTAGLGAAGTFLWVNLGETGLTFGNETYAGLYLLLAFIIGLIEFSRTREWGKLRVSLLLSLVFIALSPLLLNAVGLLTGRTPLTLLLESPSALLGLARASSAALILLLIFLAGHFLVKRFVPKPWDMRLTAGGGALIVLGIAGAIALLFTPQSAVQQAYIEESTAARIIVWEASASAVRDRPLLGWGPENFNYALERHFDPRLFMDENLGEIWFERAHNVFVDTLVGSGLVGVLSFVLLGSTFLIVVYRARRRGLIGDTEAVLLFALVPAHLLQLQTGFDTIGSYTLLGFVGGYALWLERKTLPVMTVSSMTIRKIVAGILLVGALGSVYFVALNEYVRQLALPATFKGRSLAEQQKNMEKSLERVSSFESLRLSSRSFIKGSLSIIAEKSTPERRKNILTVAHQYEEHYKRYLEVQPDHYRAHMNYAYLLLIMTTLGENRVEDAKAVILRGYELSPGHPLTYVLDALAELYRGNLAESERLIDEAVAINPEIEFTQEAKRYFDGQQKVFPNITVMKLSNL